MDFSCGLRVGMDFNDSVNRGRSDGLTLLAFLHSKYLGKGATPEAVLKAKGVVSCSVSGGLG